jgi:hypothetical protein
MFYSVQVRNEGDGDPIVSTDAVVTANDHAGFSRGATTKNHRGLGAHAGKIDCGMTGRGKKSHSAIRLFQQKRG